MKKDLNAVQKILLLVIGILTVILAAVLIRKAYLFFQEKEELQKVRVRYQEVQTEMEEVQMQIIELSEDSQALQSFLDEKIKAPEENSVSENSVSENTEASESDSAPASISENGGTEAAELVPVSGNVQPAGELFTVSGNVGTETAVTVSGNAIVDGKVIPFRYQETEITLEQRRNIQSSYAETMQINGADKARIAQNTIDFSDMKIACLGDSLTEGSNLEHLENYQQYSYPAVLKNVLKAEEVYNLGIGGSSYGRYWDQAFVDRYKEIPADTDIILVMGGTNDGFAASAKELGNREERKARTFYGDVDELMRGLKRDYPNSKIVFATPLPNVLHDYLAAERDYLLPQSLFVNAIKELAAEYQIDVVDLYNSNLLDTHDAQIISSFMPDGVHGNPGGYQILAEHFASELIAIAMRDALYAPTVSGNSLPAETVSENDVINESEDIMEEGTGGAENNAVIVPQQELPKKVLDEPEKAYEYSGEAIIIE